MGLRQNRHVASLLKVGRGGQTHPILFLNVNLRTLVAARTGASPMLRACRKYKTEFKNELV